MSHGPYLQELDTRSVSIFFEMSSPAFSSVQVRQVPKLEQGEKDAKTKTFYATQDGMRVCNVTFSAIPVCDLSPGVEYEYRIVTREVKEFSPSKMVMGVHLASPWYAFRTFSPDSESCSVLVMSDLHDKADMFQVLLQHGGIDTCDAVFLVGDVMHHISKTDTPYASYLDRAVEVFAKHRPFIHARGNHETRGAAALDFPRYIRCSKEHLYGTQEIGNAMFIYLDTGEYQADSHPEYSGAMDSDAYRIEQAEWLKKLAQTVAFKNAKYRIVLCHFPIFEEEVARRHEHGIKDFSAKILPILNESGIDLLIAGHTHKFDFRPPVPNKRAFPVLIGSNMSATRLDVRDNQIRIRAYDKAGKTLLETTIDRLGLVPHAEFGAHQRDPYNWKERHEAVKAQNKANPPEIVVIGDSITHRWGGLPANQNMDVVGQDSWNDLFGKRAVTNMGFGFDYIENAYFRVQDGELDGCKPRVIVLLIGTNNLGHKMDTPDLCVANFHILLKLIRQKCPESKILICGLLPRREPSLMKLISQVNAKYAELTDGKTVFYADLGADMVGTDSLASPDLLSDSVHPNSKGYKLMSNQLDVALKKIDK